MMTDSRPTTTKAAAGTSVMTGLAPMVGHDDERQRRGLHETGRHGASTP